uniref:mRNA guanylyltransferase n=1 Tax=Mantoniella tinhauana virus 1 TaxID=3111543 RepID=A0AB38ZM25_9VIRU
MSTAFYKYVTTFIHTQWGTKNFFPGPQPISIEYKHFPILKSGEYYVCEKTDGERCMMVALTYEGQGRCVFVNRNFEMTDVTLRLGKSAYEGTILDGELYEGTLMVYDAVIVSGVPVWDKPLDERLSAAKDLMKPIIYMKSDVHRLKCKTFHHMRDFAHFMDVYLPTVEQKIDGLIFTPVNEPVRTGTHETMFKWKPREKNTIDFLMKWEPTRETPGVAKGEHRWRLYVQEKGKLYFESEILTNEPWYEDGAIVECQYITWEEPMWWKPLKRRFDKSHPNNRRTFYRTIVNIKEDIQMKEFLDCIP